MTEFKQLTETEFDEQFELIKNHIDDNASWSGNMFETYGEEVQFVLEMAKQNRVITIIEGEGDADFDYDELYENGDDLPPDPLYYVSGYHLVNRIGYLITKEPLPFEFEVELDD
jgi:hypothetical protein